MTSLDHLDDAELLEWFEDLLESTRTRFPGSPETRSYGEDPLNVVDLWGDQDASIWVISIHGGYFAAEYDRTVNEPLCRSLASEGIAVANVEYRRTGSAPDPRTTVSDVRTAIAKVLECKPEHSSVVVVGHSAGGYLALTGAMAGGIAAVFPLAPVTDLVAIAQGGWDDGAIARWLENAPEGEAAWSALQPESIGMTRAPIRILHGTTDAVVPVELAREFVTRHPQARLQEFEGLGHYEFLDPGSVATRALAREIRSCTSAG